MITQKINFSELHDFLLWNEKGISFKNYVDYNASPDILIGVIAIFFTEFVSYRNGIFLGYKFRKDIADQWFEHFDNDLKKVEKAMNYVEVASGLFQFALEDQSYQNVAYIGEKLAEIWEYRINKDFPHLKFEFLSDKHDEVDDFVISFWQV